MDDRINRAYRKAEAFDDLARVAGGLGDYVLAEHFSKRAAEAVATAQAIAAGRPAPPFRPHTWLRDHRSDQQPQKTAAGRASVAKGRRRAGGAG